jgi:hypothetical protein
MLLILNDKNFNRNYLAPKVKIGWTIGIFLALIPEKGTARRGRGKPASGH